MAISELYQNKSVDFEPVDVHAITMYNGSGEGSSI